MTKERLKNYRAAYLEALQLKKELDELEAHAGYYPTPALSGLPGGGGLRASAEERYTESVDRLDRRYREKLADLLLEQCCIEEAIEALENPVERRLMRARYLDGLRWESVCVEIGYSWQQTHRLHARALLNIADK